MGTVKRTKEAMTTIQIARSTAAELQKFGHWGDTYDAIIRRFLNGSKGAPDENSESNRDELARTSHHQVE